MDHIALLRWLRFATFGERQEFFRGDHELTLAGKARGAEGATIRLWRLPDPRTAFRECRKVQVLFQVATQAQFFGLIDLDQVKDDRGYIYSAIRRPATADARVWLDQARRLNPPHDFNEPHLSRSLGIWMRECERKERGESPKFQLIQGGRAGEPPDRRPVAAEPAAA